MTIILYFLCAPQLGAPDTSLSGASHLFCFCIKLSYHWALKTAPECPTKLRCIKFHNDQFHWRIKKYSWVLLRDAQQHY